jgi:hypothetical protein
MARIDPETGAVRGALDIIQLSIHDGLNSHLDALCHYQGPIGRKPSEPAVSYNGFPFTLTAAGFTLQIYQIQGGTASPFTGLATF